MKELAKESKDLTKESKELAKELKERAVGLSSPNAPSTLRAFESFAPSNPS